MKEWKVLLETIDILLLGHGTSFRFYFLAAPLLSSLLVSSIAHGSFISILQFNQNVSVKTRMESINGMPPGELRMCIDQINDNDKIMLREFQRLARQTPNKYVQKNKEIWPLQNFKQFSKEK